MGQRIKIHVAGDAYWAYFYIPEGKCALKGKEGGRVHAMPVGAEYIYQAIKAASAPDDLLSEKAPIRRRDVEITRGLGSWTDPESNPAAFYEVHEAVDTIPDHDIPHQKLPLLRLVRTETQRVELEGVKVDAPAIRSGKDEKLEKNRDVLVTWFGELAGRQTFNHRITPVSCRIHIQVGLPAPLDAQGGAEFRSQHVAKPEHARILVVNVGELCDARRIRKSLSYEAIAVDLLRILRGSDAKPTAEDLLEKLSMTGVGAAPYSVLAVRLNDSAVFVYSRNNNEEERTASGNDYKEEEAWLLCHRKECAPLSQPEVRQMVGYTGFVSAQTAAAVAGYLSTLNRRRIGPKELQQAILKGVRRSLVWQRINVDRGCLHMLFKKDKEKNWIATSKSDPPPKNNKPKLLTNWRMNYEPMFEDIVKTLKIEQGSAGKKAGTRAKLPSRLQQFDAQSEKAVVEVGVDIPRAVAHRTPWFMARSLVKEALRADELLEKLSEDEKIKKKFRQIALGWLSEAKGEQGQRSVKIPVVHIGKAELTDRREIEDFLAIQQALDVYAHAREAKPLNIAVFGAPGSGKSFAVRQVVEHISKTHKDRFNKQPLTFNLAQFTSLDDLPAALHLVRNESLAREIPIVFFDEFDSSFNGQPFGWLKYFLAPMQDGQFYHAGQNYKVGHAVFVFAGGVNRSFEELNGRVRNPGFCEAKGPDFISRLKAHLNVQGINESESEADQGRYVLRRGILLRGLVRTKLKLKDEQKDQKLLHPSVAYALLEIDRFKHGVRSLEAIVKMCATREGHPIGPSDLPSMDQLEMHVDAMKLLKHVEEYASSKK